LSSSELNQPNTFCVSVYSSDENNKKSVYVPYTQDVNFLRKVIADAFDLSVNEFALYANNKLITQEDNETLIKEIGFGTMFFISSKTIHNFMSEHHPKNILVGNQEFFNKMFGLLSNDEEYEVESIWKLLMKLPQNEVPTAKRIQTLEMEDESNWDELIDGSSLQKLLYSLQIVSKLLLTESEWQNKFLVMGGVTHLFKTFLKIDPRKINSALAFKSVDLLCQILCESMEKTQELISYFKERNAEVVEQLIKIIHEVTRLSLSELKKRGESYDEIYYKDKLSEQKNYRFMNYYSDKNNNDEAKESKTGKLSYTSLS
jgi:hypothetical protein